MKKMLVAASTLLMLSSPMLVHAQDTVDITYQHVSKNTLSTEQQNNIQTDRLTGVATEMETIVLVYEKDSACLISNPNEKVPNKPDEQTPVITGMLPKTGEAISYSLIVGTGVLLGAIWLLKNKKTRSMMVFVLVGIAGVSNTVLADGNTIVTDIQQPYATNSVFVHQAQEIKCYRYVGYIRTPRPNKPVTPVTPTPPVAPTPTTPVTPTPPTPPVTPPTPPTIPVAPTEEKKGSVIAKFVDEQGNTLQDDVTVADKVAIGSAYTATKPDRITTKDGKVYVFKEIKSGSASETGKVTEDTQVVTYVYTEEKKGSVIAKFVDEQGNTVQDDVTVADKVAIGSAYTATKPDKITTKDGKVYVFKEIKVDSASETGKVTEDTQTVTYVYEEVKGKVFVTYVNEAGDEIKAAETIVSDASIGTYYDATTKKYEKITTADGKVYTFKEHKADLAAEGGKVTEKDTTVTYVYTEVKGSVIAKFVDEQGNPVQTDVTVADKESVGSTYNATKPDRITTTDGKVYAFKEIKADSASETGKVTEDTQTVTYVYTEVTGSVIVKYVNEAGEEIKDAQTVLSDKSVGTAYDTSAQKVETITTTDGKVYTFKQLKSGTETGTVVEGTQEVVYEYTLQAKTGAVIARFWSATTKIQDDVVVKPENTPVGEAYSYTPPRAIVYNGETYDLYSSGKGYETDESSGSFTVESHVVEGVTYIDYYYVTTTLITPGASTNIL